MDLQEKYEMVHRRIKAQKELAIKSLTLLEELYKSSIYKSFKENDEAQVDEIDILLNDSVKLELLLNTINESIYENEDQYNIDIRRLYEVLNRTERRNQDDPGNLTGLIQKLENDKIVIETNREYKYKMNDEAASN